VRSNEILTCQAQFPFSRMIRGGRLHAETTNIPTCSLPPSISDAPSVC
jgi:hypothetical protein